MKSTDYIKDWLEENLSTKRYSHSIGCAECAKKLAKIYNQDEEKAYLAGLIHDSAKNLEDSKLYEIITNDIKTGYSETKLKNPKTYHAIVGAFFAEKVFEIDDNQIISAVRFHTLGKTSMTTFEKIIYLADKIEPNERDEKYSKKIYKILEQNKGTIGLDLAILKCTKETIKSLIKRQLYICPETIAVYNNLIIKVGDLLDKDD